MNPNLSNQWYSNTSISSPIIELSEKCDLLIQEYKNCLEKNHDLKDSIEKCQKEKLLLLQPQFFETEMHKINLMIQTYKDTLEELETQSKFTLERLHNCENT